MTKVARTAGWAGTVRVVKNGYLGCWEYEFYPTPEWKRENPGAHPELMFTPCDTEADAIFEAQEWANYTGALFIPRISVAA